MKRNEISNYHGQNQGRCHLAAAIQLAVQRDKLEVEVLEEPVKGLFGVLEERMPR